jgi:hypothetical protein
MLRGTGPLKTVRERLVRTEESGGEQYIVTSTVTLHLPDGVRDELCWNEACWSNTVTGERGWSADSAGSQAMIEVERRALLREAGRHPWFLAAQRDKAGFIASSTGERRVVAAGGEPAQDCSIVRVHWDGTGTMLAVDDAGRVRMLSYRGRGPDATIGTIERVYSRFHDVGGYELPGHVEVLFNGKPALKQCGDYAEQAVNDAADRAAFEPPPPPPPPPPGGAS